MGFHSGFSVQGQFSIPTTTKVYSVSLTKDKTKNTPDLSAPDATSDSWFVYHPYGGHMTTISIQNLSDDPIHFSYMGGERWSTLLNKGATWEGLVNITFFRVKADVAPSVFQFTASGV